MKEVQAMSIKVRKITVVKALLLIWGLIALLTVSITDINAYFTDADTAINEIIYGSVDTKIVEDYTPERPDPGDEIKKVVSIQNVGKSDCYVRVKALFSDSDMEKVCTVDWNTTDWVYNSADGYYYYKGRIKNGESTTNLCTAVKVLPTATNIKKFDIIVYAECCQAEPHSNYKEAWEYLERNK